VKRGEAIGAGGSAEVFAWGADRVLKLFRPRYQYAVDMEYARAQAVVSCGIAAPRVDEIVESDGRRGIVFERIDGPTLLSRIASDGTAHVAERLAEVHREIHRHRAIGLPTYADLTAKAGDRSPAALERYAQVPGGDSVFHGDLHPGNVLLTGDGPVVLDWVNALAAHPALDVARSTLLMAYQGLTATTPDSIRALRTELTDAYLTSYLAGSNVTLAEVERCQPAMAAPLLAAEPGSPVRRALEELAAQRVRPSA
jgi:tRNA A-37 threonylcarbamoyl transferase component Bud32